MFGFAIWQRNTYSYKYTIFQLIDFQKSELINLNPRELEGNSLLYFVIRNVTENGEFIPILKNGIKTTDKNGNTKYYAVYKQAFYRGLEFRIYEPTKAHPNSRITVEGSLHKYWNKGAHNFNDFGIVQIIEVFKDLKEKFNITPENCVLKQLEIGVNINPPIKTKNILKHCLMHKTNQLKSVFTSDEGNYIQNKNQRHYNKFYDKKTHYANKGFDIREEIMRIEKKYSKMLELNSKGIYTLKDLLDYGLIGFKSDLLTMWQNVLYCDLSTVKGTKNEYKYTSLIWWQNLNYENFKYHRNQLNKLLNKNPKNIKKIVSELISKKCEFLNTNTTEINPLDIQLNTVGSMFKKQDENRCFCSVTKLNISMQKSDSILLSHTGLRYYLKTDTKVFNEIKRKYLSDKWTMSDVETQIKEIAHNIRNTNYNTTNKQKRIYPTEQLQLFNINTLAS